MKRKKKMEPIYRGSGVERKGDSIETDPWWAQILELSDIYYILQYRYYEHI